MKLIRFSFLALVIAIVIGVFSGWIPIPLFNTIAILLFLPLLILGAATTVARGARYYSVHEPLPRLLIRDLISRTGLAVPLTMIFGARFFGPQPGLAQEAWWVLATAIPAVTSVAVYAYYEIFVLDGPDRAVHRLVPEQLADISRKIDVNTKISEDAFHEANTVNLKIADLQKRFDELIREAIVADKQRDMVSDARDATAEARYVQQGLRNKVIDEGIALGEDTHEKVVDIHKATLKE